MKGYAVESLQDMLGQLGFYTGELSGDFDEETGRAVALFQEKYGLDTIIEVFVHMINPVVSSRLRVREPFRERIPFDQAG